jgi:dTDP-4-amino-4,6-dideoxygalactose transaminase
VTWSVPLSDLQIDDELRSAVAETVASGWWSMGPRVAQFEEEFAAFCGARHALAVSSGTAALHLALLGVGCGEGDEVVLPSLNFVAAANVVVHVGAAPVFTDINNISNTSSVDFHNLNLDPVDLESALGPAAKAIVVLHYGGFPCDMDAVSEIAGRRGVAVIEDAAHAPGATWSGRKCGTLGSVGCFSFFSNKNLPIGEGGMVVTDDDAIADRMRLLRSHGMTTLTWDRHRGHAAGYDVLVHGFNYRLDEMRAAVGLVQLGRLEQWNAARARIAARYRTALDGVNGLQMPFAEPDPRATSAHHLAVVVLPPDAAREPVRTMLGERGIQTSVHYPPIHSFSAYAGRSHRPLPRTDAVADRLLTLPLYPHLEDGQVDAVVESLLDAVSRARRGTARAGPDPARPPPVANP